jgi:hypothetical protein
MKRSLTLIGSILMIVSLVLLSFWFYKRAHQIEGPTRIIRGPQNEIYVLVDDYIVKLSSDGDVQRTFNLPNSMGIDEPVADFFVEPNDDLLIGLKSSQIIKLFSSDGHFKRDHSRQPSSLVNGDRSFKFTKNPTIGILYVADSTPARTQERQQKESCQRYPTEDSPSGSGRTGAYICGDSAASRRMYLDNYSGA